MSLCKLVDAFYRGLPLSFFRSCLLRRHIDQCPACQHRILSRDEATSLLLQAHDLQGREALWPGLQMRLEEGERRSQAAGFRFLSYWRWAAGAILVFILIAAGLWLEKGVRMERQDAGTIPAESFSIDYVRIGGELANAIIYQPRDSDIIIIWAEKTL